MSEKFTLKQLKAAEEWLDAQDADALRASVFEDVDAVGTWIEELALHYAVAGLARVAKTAHEQGEAPDLANIFQAMIAAAIETGFMLRYGIQSNDKEAERD